MAVSAETTNVPEGGLGTEQSGSAADLLPPVFPTIFSQGWSVRMFSSSGEMRGVRDQSRTVLSLLQLAMVKGRLW